jgi:hypothetical protein
MGRHGCEDAKGPADDQQSHCSYHRLRHRPRSISRDATLGVVIPN